MNQNTLDELVNINKALIFLEEEYTKRRDNLEKKKSFINNTCDHTNVDGSTAFTHTIQCCDGVTSYACSICNTPEDYAKWVAETRVEKEVELDRSTPCITVKTLNNPVSQE